jgi:choline dehydrogenase
LLMGMNFRARRRIGLARDGGGGSVLNWRSSTADRPDLHAVVIQGRHADPDGAARYGVNGDGDVFAISPGLMSPRGIGALTVRDVAKSGPAAVEIESGMLTEQADVDALVEAVDLILDLAATKAYAAIIDKPLMPPGRLSRAEKERFVRQTCATFFHPVGTAAMGTGPDAVVDAGLRVYGTDGLYVADASVIPVIPTCNTQAPVVAIAERAVDLIIAGAALARSAGLTKRIRSVSPSGTSRVRTTGSPRARRSTSSS